jgi:hypothetical protein
MRRRERDNFSGSEDEELLEDNDDDGGSEATPARLKVKIGCQPPASLGTGCRARTTIDYG